MSAVELSLVMPVKDEEAAIGPCLARVIPVIEAMDDPAARSFEILFVDDGSSDATLEVIRKANAADSRVRGISLSRNFGKEAALTAGLDAALGSAVVPLDVDLQDPPETLPKMIAQWRQGFDVVYGVRDNRESDSLPKRITADFYYRAHNWLSNDKIPEHAGDFRLLDRRVVDVIRAMPERNRFMKGLYAWIGFDAVALPYVPAPRAHGSSRFNGARLLRLSLDGLTAFANWPLRVVAPLGMLLALASFAYGGVLVLDYMLYGHPVSGWTTIVVLLTFFFGAQMIFLGVIGEYLARVYEEVKERPLYLVKRESGQGLAQRTTP